MRKIKLADGKRLKHIENYIIQLNSLIYEIDSYDAFHKDWKLCHATAKLIENIFELSINLSLDLKSELSQLNWKDMAGMRVILAHKHFKMDWKIVYETDIVDIPQLEKLIHPMRQ